MDANWDDYRYFLALFEAGSVAGAAKAAGVDGTTISRRIAALERSLRVRLTYRKNRAWYFTDAGKKLIETLRPLKDGIENFSLHTAGMDKRLQGLVRLTAPDGIASRMIIPVLGEYWKRHPAVEIEIISSSQLLNIQGRDADLAVRLMKPESGHLYAKKVGALEFGVFASREYLRQAGEPKAENLAEHTLISYALAESSLDERALSKKLSSMTGRRLTVSTRPALLSALSEGYGLGILPIYLADKGLVRVLPHLGFSEQVWIVTHEDLKHNAKVRTLTDFLVDSLKVALS